MSTTAKEQQAAEQRRREVFCKAHGHVFLTNLPNFKAIEHKRCQYCGAKKRPEDRF